MAIIRFTTVNYRVGEIAQFTPNPKTHILILFNCEVTVLGYQLHHLDGTSYLSLITENDYGDRLFWLPSKPGVYKTDIEELSRWVDYQEDHIYIFNVWNYEILLETR